MNYQTAAALGFLWAVLSITVGCGSNQSATPVSTTQSSASAPESNAHAVPDMTVALGGKGDASAEVADDARDDEGTGHGASQSTGHGAPQRSVHGGEANADDGQGTGHGGVKPIGHGVHGGHGGNADDGTDDDTAADEQVEEERQVAVAGVGKKGSRYGGGIITEPVSQYFGMRERITFISVQKAMRTFEAMHERLPESHEEFMKEIIEENGLELPTLYPDERYEYDAEAGELMVVRPKKK